MQLILTYGWGRGEKIVGKRQDTDEPFFLVKKILTWPYQTAGKRLACL